MKIEKSLTIFYDKNGISNLTAGQQLFENFYDRLKMSFVKDTETLSFEEVVETNNKDDLYTTDLNKCRENAEKKLWIKFLTNINWETFTHDELKKVFDIVGNILIAKESADN